MVLGGERKHINLISIEKEMAICICPSKKFSTIKTKKMKSDMRGKLKHHLVKNFTSDLVLAGEVWSSRNK